MMRKRAGLTLIELILVVAIIGFVMASMVPFLGGINRVWRYSDVRTQLLQNARVSMDKMIKVIRSAKIITDIDSSGQGNYIALSDQKDSTIIFFYNVPGSKYYIGETRAIKNNDLVMRTEDRRGTLIYSLLAISLERINFTYLKETMDEKNPATSANQTQAVKIDMDFSSPEESGVLSVSALVYGRNIVASGRGAVWVAAVGTQIHGIIIKLDSKGNEVIRKESGFDYPNDISVNPTDGSCWVASKVDVVKLDKDGNELVRISGFTYSTGISVNPTDGSCWVADFGNKVVVKLDSNGNELLRKDGFVEKPYDVSVNPTDGSCWVSDNYGATVVKLDSTGNELVRKTGINLPYTISVNPTDGSCWVAASNLAVLKLDKDGNELVRNDGIKHPTNLSVNPTDGSCWVVDSSPPAALKLDTEGNEHVKISGFQSPRGISVNPNDGSCWVGAYREVRKLDSSGNELVKVEIGPKTYFAYVYAVSVDTGERQ